ncbi:MAG: TonB-dependent siderophore receptor, partial [Acidimicrobiia bacterium]
MKIASAVIAVVFSVVAALLSSGTAAEQLTATSAAQTSPAVTEPAFVPLTAAVTVAEADNIVLPEMTVTATGRAETDYSVFSTTTATKTDAPIMQTPVSIQVVPKAVIEDQKATRIKDALENVSGVRPNSSLGSGNRFIVRGFADGGKLYRNGLLATSPSGFRTEFDTATPESIEVLKGPAAVLFGRIEPGGLINITATRPLDTPYYSLEQRFGSYDFYRTEWDATGPLTRDKSLLYRFDGAYQDSESFRDFNFIERLVLHPSLTWRPTASTEMTVEVESLHHDFRPDFGIPVIGRQPAPVPISRSYGDPNVPEANNDKILVGFNLSHQFNRSWKLENRFLASFLETFDT